MLRWRTDWTKLFSPGGPVSKIAEICWGWISATSMTCGKNRWTPSSHTGFATILAAIRVVACKFLQHGKSPHPFPFWGCEECCFAACIGHCELTFVFDGTAGAARTQWLLSTNHAAIDVATTRGRKICEAWLTWMLNLLTFYDSASSRNVGNRRVFLQPLHAWYALAKLMNKFLRLFRRLLCGNRPAIRGAARNVLFPVV